MDENLFDVLFISQKLQLPLDISITLYLFLYPCIKGILSIMAIQNIICSTIMTISTAVMINLRGQTFWTCQSLVTAMYVLTRSHSVLTPLVSIVRYAMASKVESIQDYNFRMDIQIKVHLWVMSTDQKCILSFFYFSFQNSDFQDNFSALNLSKISFLFKKFWLGEQLL